MSSEKEINKRVAKALGWTYHKKKRMVDHGVVWYIKPRWRKPDDAHPIFNLPDFASDPAFVLGMIEANRDKNFMIDAYHDGAQHAVGWSLSLPGLWHRQRPQYLVSVHDSGRHGQRNPLG